MSAPTPKEIIKTAKELHESYRAAFKALDRTITRRKREGAFTRKVTETRSTRHDHGFHSCTSKGKAYFLRRAVHVLKQRESKVPF